MPRIIGWKRDNLFMALEEKIRMEVLHIQIKASKAKGKEIAIVS